MTIHWKAVEQYFTLVCNLERFISFGLGAVRSEWVNICRQYFCHVYSVFTIVNKTINAHQPKSSVTAVTTAGSPLPLLVRANTFSTRNVNTYTTESLRSGFTANL